MQTDELSTVVPNDQQYKVIALSIQKDGSHYVVGSAEMGDFFQFPSEGIDILTMLQDGNPPSAIKSHLSVDGSEAVDVDNFIAQLMDIGFVYREDLRQRAPNPQQATGRAFNIDPRLARALFSLPMLCCYLAFVLYALSAAVMNPALRINPDVLYIETNRTLLLLIVLGLSLIQTAAHEMGHMTAAARQGIKSRYGVGTRMWTIVAESDLTGILALPKSQRYLPMLAGLLVDILCLALFTILLDVLLRLDARPFTVQVVQVMALETTVTMAWQFNVFIKTDIYFVLCNFFSYPDLDLDARAYLRHLLHRATFGRFGAVAPRRIFDHLKILRIFALIWAFGRTLAMILLCAVFLPTMWRYLESAIRMLNGPPASLWAAIDTIAYVSILLTMLGAGMYMWLKPQWQNREAS